MAKEPENLDEEYRMVRNRHLKFIGVPLIFAIIFYITGHYGWMMGIIILAIIIHYADSKFHYWNLEKTGSAPKPFPEKVKQFSTNECTSISEGRSKAEFKKKLCNLKF
ncbi:MAG: hypothetical protein H5T40_06660 [Methanobacteriales archaeon]|nr:hypothetical protein [Methanobacteriales archaeon]